MTHQIDYQSVPPPARPARSGQRILPWVLFIGLAIMLFLLLNQGRNQYDELPLSTFRDLLEHDFVASVTIEADELYGQLKPNGMTTIINYKTALPQGTASSWTFTQWLLQNRGNAVVDARNQTNLLLQVFLPLVPWLLIFGFIWFFVIRQIRRSAQTNAPLRVVVVGHEMGTDQAGVS